MAASFFVNAMQVEFESVIAMENTGMAKMFKSLDDTRLNGFLEASDSVYEAVVLEFLANAKVIAGMIVSFVDNRKLALTKEFFVEEFGLPIEGLVGFLDIPSNTVREMRMKFSGGSFDVVTSEKFDLMVAISAGLQVNWAQVLFQTLMAMVNMSTKQSQGFAVQVSTLLQNLVKADLGELVKLQAKSVDQQIGFTLI
ncbi:hypothetical protein F511_20366 [Dorcoceras hygrometricum]|uniref:Dystroglycan-like n=1 Tax=Dorcoceras hygrometricum TaxID=472368 RepID=A0A2Z7CM52_9LAMI|nr:hypothetical protein F511_20366 [Dorcoceras hygrometricum]